MTTAPTTADPQELTLDVVQSIEINASMEAAYDALIRRLSSENAGANNTPMPMVLEPWPGGRWFRDLGEQTGHLWGLVQVIKPPTLIEIHGPMFMSYAVAGHLQLRLTEVDAGVELTLRHRVLGFLEEGHREGLKSGWNGFVTGVKALAE